MLGQVRIEFYSAIKLKTNIEKESVKLILLNYSIARFKIKILLYIFLNLIFGFVLIH